VPPQQTAPQPPSGSSGSSVTYDPHVTVYQGNYESTFPCFPQPCPPPPGPVPINALAASSTGTTFYFHDLNFGTVEMTGGKFSTYVSRTYDDNGTSVNSGMLWAFDPFDTLYTVGSTASQTYLVSHADASSGQTFTPVTGASDDDLEASTISGRVYIGGGAGLTVVDGANSGSGTVHTVNLPTNDNCAYRIVEGVNHEVDVSNCATFNHIFRYSSNLQLLASATVSNASHITEIAPDPDGGVWFADDIAKLLGKMSANGTVTEFPLPANTTINAIATASDGSIWAALSTSTTTAFLAHVSENGTLTTYPFPSTLLQVVYLRGTFGLPASCTPNRLYAVDVDGNIGVIDLNPT
jgi:hypothetical protein